MDFQAYVRSQLPPLRVRREPEIVAEIAEHLTEIYDEARREGLTHSAAEARVGVAAVLPRRLRPRPANGRRPLAPVKSRLAFWTDARTDVRYGLRGLLHAPGFTLAIARGRSSG